jgi:hypothetical protein
MFVHDMVLMDDRHKARDNQVDEEDHTVEHYKDYDGFVQGLFFEEILQFVENGVNVHVRK